MTLTDTQLVLLSAASRREDGAIVLTANLKGGVAGKVIGKLLRDGLVEEVPSGASMPVWRRDADARPLSIRITPGGLASIGLEGDVMQPAKEPSTTERRADGSPKRPARAVSGGAMRVPADATAVAPNLKSGGTIFLDGTMDLSKSARGFLSAGAVGTERRCGDRFRQYRIFGRGR